MFPQKQLNGSHTESEQFVKVQSFLSISQFRAFITLLKIATMTHKLCQYRIKFTCIFWLWKMHTFMSPTTPHHTTPHHTTHTTQHLRPKGSKKIWTQGKNFLSVLKLWVAVSPKQRLIHKYFLCLIRDLVLQWKQEIVRLVPPFFRKGMTRPQLHDHVAPRKWPNPARGPNHPPKNYMQRVKEALKISRRSVQRVKSYCTFSQWRIHGPTDTQ